jgi:[protein-PII] uridylyltransferase
MTPWRSDQLWRAYLAGYGELTRELETERIHDHPDDPGISAFLEGLPARYLRTHQPAEVRTHAALAQQAAAAGVALEITRINGYWRVVVAAGDRPFLFASIAGVLSAFGMNILKAEAFANARRLILDTFTFSDPMRTLELNPSEVDRLRNTLERVITGKQDVKRLLASRAQRARTIRSAQPTVAFNNEASPAATLIEIVAEDRPGLLYDLASVISSEGCDIVVVLIDTEGTRALDVFYVTANGQKLKGDQQVALRDKLIAII